MGRVLRYLVLLLCCAAFQLNAAPLKVALIDHFYPAMNVDGLEPDLRNQRQLYGMLDLDGDQLPDPFYHGDLVQLLASHPQLIFLRYPLRTGGDALAQIVRQLEHLRQRHQGQPVDALLLAWESSTLISAFEHPLNPAHSKHYKALIREWGHGSAIWRATYQIIRLMEQLQRDGVQVFTIAGNGGTRMVNTFSFAEGVITVGASEQELRHFIADNPFVDQYAPAAYRPRQLVGPAGEALGYDLNNDGCVDIGLERLALTAEEMARGAREHWQQLKGSSFAAPVKLRQMLVTERGCNR